MSRLVALIDGEHYPPVVRFALTELAKRGEVVGAAFIGGTEKVDLDRGLETYGVPVVTAAVPEDAIRSAIDRFAPDELVDLSDEPVLSSADRFRLASVALERGVAYRGADFSFTPPRDLVTTSTPALGIIGTGKRVGKTSVSAYIARLLKASGRDIVVLAMGRGGPAEPELIHGERVELTTPDLLALARQGKHASSDNYEDAVMSRVTTVGCRRCGGGMAGETFFSNVPEGARLADSLGKELVVLEGSGAAIPPVFADALDHRGRGRTRSGLRARLLRPVPASRAPTSSFSHPPRSRSRARTMSRSCGRRSPSSRRTFPWSRRPSARHRSSPSRDAASSSPPRHRSRSLRGSRRTWPSSTAPRSSR